MPRLPAGSGRPTSEGRSASGAAAPARARRRAARAGEPTAVPRGRRARIQGGREFVVPIRRPRCSVGAPIPRQGGSAVAKDKKDTKDKGKKGKKGK